MPALAAALASSSPHLRRPRKVVQPQHAGAREVRRRHVAAHEVHVEARCDAPRVRDEALAQQLVPHARQAAAERGEEALLPQGGPADGDGDRQVFDGR